MDSPAISAEIVTPSEFLRLKKGSEDSKLLETKANDEPKPDDSKNDTKKPDNAPAPPPPPQEVAKLDEPPPPEPEKPTEPDQITKKLEEAPPPPAGPTPDEQKQLDQKLMEQKLEEQRKADEEAKKKADEEAKKKADEEAKKKADEDAKKKAEEAKKKKAAEEARKKKLAEQKRKEAEKKKFDPSKIASLLDKAKDDAPQKALLDKDPTKKGQQASGTRDDALAPVGQEAGTATGADMVLSLREQDMLKGMLKAQLNGCWRPPGTGGGDEIPVVTLSWEMNPDGTLRTQPKVTHAPSTPAGQVYAEAAVRAVKTCEPFRLPPDKYEGGWRFIDWTFDPRELL